jgi:choline dehydrogenase-like flavoprotein
VPHIPGRHVWHVTERYDVIIVGSGAGGGTLAHTLAPSGKRTDPASSVLDVNCKAHEVDNLYVVDTGFFPSIGAVNPRAHRHGQRDPRRRPPAEADGATGPVTPMK